MLHRMSRFQRSQDSVGIYRCAPEYFVAHRVCKSIENRGTTTADGPLANATRANRCFRIRNVERFPLHIVRHIQDSGGPVLVEALCHRDAIMRVVHPLLADGVGDTQCRSAEDLTAERSRM